MNSRRIQPIIPRALILLMLSCVTFFCVPARSEAVTLLCNDCHGTRSPADIRPLDDSAGERNPETGGFKGNHRTHLPANSSAGSCEPCHAGSTSYTSEHRNALISLTPRINNSPVATRYGNASSAIPFSQTPTPIPAKCSNVNCHFEGQTPFWGDPAKNCGICHGAPPTDGAHGKKHGEYYGTGTTSCVKCHPDHQDNYTHPLEVGTRPLAIQFTTLPNSGGQYSGDVSYPKYLPSQGSARNGTCTNIYCHSDGLRSSGNQTVSWSMSGTTECYSCHKGRASDNIDFKCYSSGGTWNGINCTPFLHMTSNGHGKLIGPQWIRKYACTYCHYATTDASGNISDRSKHANGSKDVKMAPEWNIVGKPEASYDAATKKCYNVYCHSDGTYNPVEVREFSWTEPAAKCNTCHGHPIDSCSTAGCHDNTQDPDTGEYRTLPSRFGTYPNYAWPPGEEWKSSVPMFANAVGNPNSHNRHVENGFSCDLCHYLTIRQADDSCNNTAGCHPHTTGSMDEAAHLNGDWHVNRIRDVSFKEDGGYNKDTKTCSGTSSTKCHGGGPDPKWGEPDGAVPVICFNCHGTTLGDVDDFGAAFNGTQARINMTDWEVTGHGRYSTSGRYPASGNPAANFPGNPCWYCHDNSVYHKDDNNPFRLRLHPQFNSRFEKECVYCHMEWKEDGSECVGCHVNQPESLAPQATANGIIFKNPDGSSETHYTNHRYTVNCINGVDGAITCHTSDTGEFASGAHKGHDSGAGTWTADQKNDVRNQYLLMGVCLKCHDDDSGGKCTDCHTSSDPYKYAIGYNPGTSGSRWIKPKKAVATSGHFGYKHYRVFNASGGWEKVKSDTKSPIFGTFTAYKGTWKGGKFCWDCHDPHGDKNIYMIQDKVAVTTDGWFGKPIQRASVTFTRKQGGLDYVRIEPNANGEYDGICNVCHSSGTQHFSSTGGNTHNLSRVCTTCHEHRFSDSHGAKQSCNSCHFSKPIPRHSGFGLPRDCTKCHAGTIGLRMDVMTQFKANSHHVQGVDITNKHCYACHWESTTDGLIDNQHHEGYNFKTYTTVKNAKVDLVVWGTRYRPTRYSNHTTAIQFVASRMSTDNATARTESQKLNLHCISCHSDQNNDAQPFGDCKTPRQYAWDQRSIDARYSNTGFTRWSQYSTAFTNKKKKVVKAFSAHGNARDNTGGWSTTDGYDKTIPNQRPGNNPVTCFDCHSSHGSKVIGTTTSYETFNGTRNGGNLKETQAGKGGYTYNYKASKNENLAAINPYSAGAGQCFDCHLTQNSGTEVSIGNRPPWGYNSTFGATAKIMGYKDTERFGQGTKGSTARFTERDPKKTIVGGHLKASSPLASTPAETTSATCAACHDPHGITPALGNDMKYAVPLLKGTWMTSPYKEDAPPPLPSGTNATDKSWGKYGNHPSKTPVTNHYLDRNTFGPGGKISENDSQFAGLCLTCHAKSTLTDGIPRNSTPGSWTSIDRIHESVKGWGANLEHTFTCSKCHQPHNSGLPRLMQTNCLDYQHRGKPATPVQPWAADKQVPTTAHNYNEHRGFPTGNLLGNSASFEATTACHIGRFNPTYSPAAPPSQWPAGNYWNVVTPWPSLPTLP